MWNGNLNKLINKNNQDTVPRSSFFGSRVDKKNIFENAPAIFPIIVVNPVNMPKVPAKSQLFGNAALLVRSLNNNMITLNKIMPAIHNLKLSSGMSLPKYTAINTPTTIAGVNLNRYFHFTYRL